MRMLVSIRLPHEPFNTLLRQKKAESMLLRILEEIKPEAVYFSENQGRRGVILVVDLPDCGSLPALCEPWFLNFQAEVEIRVVMCTADLQRAGLEDLAERWAV